jgi:hypothetical protein
MKADLEAAVGITLIDPVVALDPNLAFRVSVAFAASRRLRRVKLVYERE